MDYGKIVENVGLDDELKNIPLNIIVKILSVVFDKYELTERK